MKKLTLLIIKGLPASGKSSFAKKIVKNHPKSWVRVCRDDIRKMLGKYWIPERENLVTSIEDHCVNKALIEGYSVIIDATNLNPKVNKKWNKLINNFNKSKTAINKELKVEIKYHSFHVPLKVCIWRDWKRGLLGGRRVGTKVIRDFYKKYCKQ